MKTIFFGAEVATIWTKVLLAISFGKAFVAGAGLGLAALGIVDVAGWLGVQWLVDAVNHERILDLFALGGGIISAGVQLIWKMLAR